MKHSIATKTPLPAGQSKFAKCSSIHPSVSQQELPGGPSAYHQRTCRNHFWVGGEVGQQRIRGLRIAVAGLGGIGGMIAETLVRAGVGHLRIADMDRIDRSNINRQMMAKKASLGQNKADAMADELRRIADDFELVVYNGGVQPEMIEEFVDGVDAIVDEIDVFALDRKVEMHRAARARGIPLYSAYAVGMGIHFYKYQGDRYTIEDFLGNDPARWSKPDAGFVLDTIGYPLPGYAGPADDFRRAIAASGAPIFGPATLLGHSVVSTRLLMDVVGGLMHREGFEPTPVMPEFLVLDAATFSFGKHRFPSKK